MNNTRTAAKNTKLTKKTAAAHVIKSKVCRIDAKDFARILKVDRATIYKQVHAGKLPTSRVIEGKMTWTKSVAAPAKRAA